MKKRFQNLTEYVDNLKSQPIPAGPSEELKNVTLQKLTAASYQSPLPLPERKMTMNRFTKFAAAAVIILAALTGLIIFTQTPQGNDTQIVNTDNTNTHIASPNDPAPNNRLALADAEDLKEIEQLYHAGKIDNLIAFLQNASPKTRITAAAFLADINSDESMQVLKTLETDDPNDPVNKAIQMITDPNDPNESAKQLTEEQRIAQLQKQGKILTFKVISKKSGQPLPDVELDIRYQGKRRTRTTDKNGLCKIELLGKNKNRITVTAKKDKFVTRQLEWQKSKTNAVVPKTYTMALESGTAIGGYIRDIERHPIENAQISISVRMDYPRPIEYNYPSGLKETTDANGFWKCSTLPTGLYAEDFYITVKHPDYIDDEHTNITVNPRESFDQLRDLTCIGIMEKGALVTGRLFDQFDKPLKGITVHVATSYGSKFTETKTDQQGWYSFPHLRPDKKILLLVQTETAAPQLTQVVPLIDMSPVDIFLSPPNTIKGKVVDSKGKGISGVRFSTENWQGYQSYNLLKWTGGRTKKDGSFQWNSAPADEFTLNLYKKGYMSIKDYPMIASEKEYQVVMYPPLTVSGNVIDAETKLPIEEFKLVPGLVHHETPTSIAWQEFPGSTWVKTFKNGQYETTFSDGYKGYAIRITAEGYFPADSNVISPDLQNEIWDFELTRNTDSNTIDGIVFCPDGNEAQNADVVICTSRSSLQITNGQITDRREAIRAGGLVTTGPDGKFSFPPQYKSFTLLALHDSGFVQVTDDSLTDSNQITLLPWGKLEGNLYIGSKPGANEDIAINYNQQHVADQPYIFLRYKATTDANGFFQFDRLKPGNARVSRAIKTSERTTGYSHAENVEIIPGQTHYVEIGGLGRPVMGKIIIPDNYTGLVDWGTGHHSISSAPQASPMSKELQEKIQQILQEVLPPDYDNMTRDQIMQWQQDFQQSEAFAQYMKKIQELTSQAQDGSKKYQHRSYPFKVQHDGAFWVDDVPAGMYKVDIRLYKGNPNGGWDHQNQIAFVDYEFEVPQMENDYSDQPLDLGPIQLKLTNQANGTKPAANFELPGLDGTDIRLSDYKSKVVMLVFYTGMTAAQQKTDNKMAALKEINDIFAENPNFVTLGITMDHNLRCANDFARDNDLNWPIAFIGSQDISNRDALMKLMQDYSINGYPTVCIIKADGIIKSTNVGSINSEKLQNEISQELQMLP